MPAGALELEMVLITFTPILPSLDTYKAPILRSIQIYIYLDLIRSLKIWLDQRNGTLTNS